MSRSDLINLNLPLGCRLWISLDTFYFVRAHASNMSTAVRVVYTFILFPPPPPPPPPASSSPGLVLGDGRENLGWRCWRCRDEVQILAQFHSASSPILLCASETLPSTEQRRVFGTDRSQYTIHKRPHCNTCPYSPHASHGALNPGRSG